MSWVVSALPPFVTAHAEGSYQEALAVRVDSDTGETEILVGDYQTSPHWIPATAAASVTAQKPNS